MVWSNMRRHSDGSRSMVAGRWGGRIVTGLSLYLTSGIGLETLEEGVLPFQEDLASDSWLMGYFIKETNLDEFFQVGYGNNLGNAAYSTAASIENGLIGRIAVTGVTSGFLTAGRVIKLVTGGGGGSSGSSSSSSPVSTGSGSPWSK